MTALISFAVSVVVLIETTSLAISWLAKALDA